MEDEFSESVCNIKSKARPTPTLQVIELNSLTLPSASFQVYYVSIALIQIIGNIQMSEQKHSIKRSVLLGLCDNFTSAVFLKYSFFPPKDEAVDVYDRARQLAKENGVSETTLDDLENYIKKAVLEIVEYDTTKLTDLCHQLMEEVLVYHGTIAKKAGATTFFIIEDDEDNPEN